MGLKDTEILMVNKREAIIFCASPQLKADFIRAISERGEFNTMTDFLVTKIRDYVNEWKGMKNGR